MVLKTGPVNVKDRQLLVLRGLGPDQLKGVIQSRGVWTDVTITAWNDLDRELGGQATLLDLERWLRDVIYPTRPGRLIPAGFVDFGPPQMWEWSADNTYQYRFKPRS